MKVIPIHPAGQASQKRSAGLIGSFQGQNEAPPTHSRPITVNGQLIEQQDIAQEAQNHPMPGGKPGWAWQAAAQALVWRSLFLQQARQRNIEADPMELEPGMWETEEEALIRQLFELVIPAADIDEAQLRAHYEQHAEQYRGPSLYEAAHILFVAPPDDSIARTEALKKAQIARQQLAQQPNRFAQLAKEYSDCPSAAQGGLMGQISSGDVVPEFEAILRQLEVGEISAPTQTRYGYHLVRLDERALGQPLPYESVRAHLQQAQEKKHWVEAGRAFMETLLQNSEIEGIDMAATPWFDEQTEDLTAQP